VPVGIFPKLPKKRISHAIQSQRGEGTLILNYVGNGKERLRVGGKESFQAQCIRDY
jgi:hypothetical protein